LFTLMGVACSRNDRATTLSAEPAGLSPLAAPGCGAPPIGAVNLETLAAGAFVIAEGEIVGDEAVEQEWGPGNVPGGRARRDGSSWSVALGWSHSRAFTKPSGIIRVRRFAHSDYFDAGGRSVAHADLPALDDSPGLATLSRGKRVFLALVPAGADRYELVGAWDVQRHRAALLAGIHSEGGDSLRAAYAGLAERAFARARVHRETIARLGATNEEGAR
jgi:hypothetical protein